jgi:hypothetical protein
VRRHRTTRIVALSPVGMHAVHAEEADWPSASVDPRRDRVIIFRIFPPDLSKMKRKIDTNSQGTENQREETRLEIDRHRMPRKQIEADEQVERPPEEFTMGAEGLLPRGLANSVAKISPRNPQAR